MKVTYTETEQSSRITVTELTVGELLEYFTDTVKHPQRGSDDEVYLPLMSPAMIMGRAVARARKKSYHSIIDRAAHIDSRKVTYQILSTVMASSASQKAQSSLRRMMRDLGYEFVKNEQDVFEISKVGSFFTFSGMPTDNQAYRWYERIVAYGETLTPYMGLDEVLQDREYINFTIGMLTQTSRSLVLPELSFTVGPNLTDEFILN